MLGKLAVIREEKILAVLGELENPTSWNIIYQKLGNKDFEANVTALNDLVLQGFVDRDETIWRTADAAIYSLAHDCEYRAGFDERMPSRL